MWTLDSVSACRDKQARPCKESTIPGVHHLEYRVNELLCRQRVQIIKIGENGFHDPTMQLLVARMIIAVSATSEEKDVVVGDAADVNEDHRSVFVNDFGTNLKVYTRTGRC